MSGAAVDGLPIGNQRNTNDFNIRAVEIKKRCPNHRMMRSSKTEDTMGATPVIGIAGGQLRSALEVVDTKLKSRSVVSGTRRE
jgi:hypothetical protein